MASHLQGAPVQKQHISPLLQPSPGACPHPGALSKGWSKRRNGSCIELGLSGTYWCCWSSFPQSYGQQGDHRKGLVSTTRLEFIQWFKEEQRGNDSHKHFDVTQTSSYCLVPLQDRSVQSRGSPGLLQAVSRSLVCSRGAVICRVVLLSTHLPARAQRHPLHHWFLMKSHCTTVPVCSYKKKKTKKHMCSAASDTSRTGKYLRVKIVDICHFNPSHEYLNAGWQGQWKASRLRAFSNFLLKSLFYAAVPKSAIFEWNWFGWKRSCVQINHLLWIRLLLLLQESIHKLHMAPSRAKTQCKAHFFLCSDR